MGMGDGLDKLLPSLGGNLEGSDPNSVEYYKEMGLKKPRQDFIDIFPTTLWKYQMKMGYHKKSGKFFFDLH